MQKFKVLKKDNGDTAEYVLDGRGNIFLKPHSKRAGEPVLVSNIRDEARKALQDITSATWQQLSGNTWFNGAIPALAILSFGVRLPAYFMPIRTKDNALKWVPNFCCAIPKHTDDYPELWQWEPLNTNKRIFLNELKAQPDLTIPAELKTACLTLPLGVFELMVFAPGKAFYSWIVPEEITDGVWGLQFRQPPLPNLFKDSSVCLGDEVVPRYCNTLEHFSLLRKQLTTNPWANDLLPAVERSAAFWVFNSDMSWTLPTKSLRNTDKDPQVFRPVYPKAIWSNNMLNILEPFYRCCNVTALAASLDITADLARQMWASALDLRIESEAE
jgi:hypothetical protein